jgi:hypothetical protein
MMSLIIQVVLHSALDPLTEASRRRKQAEKRNQAESSANQKTESTDSERKSKFFSVVGLVSKWAEARAVAHGEKTAELEFEHTKRAKAKHDVIKNAVLRIHDYMKNLEPEEVKFFLLKKGAISTRDLTDAKRETNINITKAVFWAIPEYSQGHQVQLRDLGGSIMKRGMDSAAFCNYKFVQKHLMPALLKSGIVEDRGTESRSNFYWASEEAVRNSFASAK